MKLYKTKLGRTINFIRNEHKFKRGDIVEVIRNDSDYTCYDKYIGQLGIVAAMDYSKKGNVVSLKFLDGEIYDWVPNEIKKLNYDEAHNSKNWNKSEALAKIL